MTFKPPLLPRTENKRMPIMGLKKPPHRILLPGCPEEGDTIPWTGACHFAPDSVVRVLNSKLPGVINPRRPMLPLLDAETGHVLPDTSLKLVKAFRDQEVFLATVGDHKTKVVVKFSPIPWNPLMRRLGRGLSPQPRPKYSAVQKNLLDLRLRTGDLDVLREARAYVALEKLQGSLVPLSYGFFLVKHGDEATSIMHVMEYIEGMPPAAFAEAVNAREDPAKITALLRSLFESMIEMHKCNVVHRDEASRNIFLLWPLDPYKPRLLLYDLNYSNVIDTAKSKNDARNKAFDAWLLMDKMRIIWFLEHLGGEEAKDIALEWLNSAEGRELFMRWSIHPDDLTAEQKELSWCKEE